MQISRFNLIIYNSCKWSASSNLISPDAKISYRALNCSRFVCFYSCRDPTYCTLGALYGFTLGTYTGTYLGSQEGSTEGTTGGNLEGLLLGDWLKYLDGIELDKNVGNELRFYDGKVLGTTLGSLDGISLMAWYYYFSVYFTHCLTFCTKRRELWTEGG